MSHALNRPFVCTRCRRKLLLQTARPAATIYVERRGFISLRFQTEPQQSAPPESVPPESIPQSPAPARGSLIGDYVKRKPLPTFRPLPKVDHALTDLFIAKERIGPSVQSRYSKLLYPTQETVTNVPKLEPSQLEKDLASIAEALRDPDRAFQGPYLVWERFTQSSSLQSGLDRPDKQLLQDTPVLTDLLKRIVRLRARKRRYRDSVFLPQVIGWYTGLGLMESRWNTMLLAYIVELIHNTRDSRLNATDDDVYVSRIAVFQDLCMIWQWLLNSFQTKERREHIVNPINQVVLAEIKGLNKRMHEDNPKSYPSDLTPPTVKEMYSFGTTASLEMRTLLADFCSSHVGQAEGKLLALTAVLTCHLIHSFEGASSEWSKCVLDQDSHSTFAAYALYGRWMDKASIVKAYTRISLTSKASRAIQTEIMTLRRESADQVARIESGMKKAITERNIKYASNLWNHFKELVNTAQISSEQREELNGSFLTAFFALRQTGWAIEVWNDMIQSGRSPQQGHWLTMIKGATRCGDLNSLETMWQQAKVAGIQPTNDMWTFYLEGLFQWKQGAKAMAALEEIGQAWQQTLAALHSNLQEESASSDPKITPSQEGYLPAMEPINTVILCLLKGRRKHQAQETLKWAASFGLQPDVRTYRHLLFDAVRHDDVSEVHKLIRDLELAKIKPSVEIFTVLMDFAFRNSESDFQLQSPEDQQETVTKVLADMEDAGIEADSFTYSTLLSGLLKPPCFNITAARAIIEQMTAKGIKVSPHTHTILITHYFSLNPPDLPAIDSLWAKIQLERHPVDHVFFDRMIEEYARIGELEKMLIFLRKMVAMGKLPGWDTLSRILRVLARAQEWAWVQDLLRDVVDERGLLKYGSRNTKGKENFWALVEELRMEGLELPQRPRDLYVLLKEGEGAKG